MRYLALSILALLLFSCATTQRKEQGAIRALVESGDYQGALAEINNSKSLKEAKSELLFYLERGATHFYAKNYYQSVLDLDMAKSIVDKLYLSIGSKISASLLNDNTDQFYGELYERSHIHFLLALNHFLLFENGKYETYMPDGKTAVPEKILTDKERKDELFRARAEIVSWDSLLKSVNDDRLGKSVYKVDLLGKIFGAMIHETIGTRDDEQIAYQLYVDAKEALFKNYNNYSTFNTRALDFKKDYEKLPSLKKEEVEKDYITSTPYQAKLHRFLDEKIVRYAKLHRKGEFKEILRRLNIPNDFAEKVDPKVVPNVKIVMSQSIISSKAPQEVYFGLKKAIEGDSAAAKFGATILSFFAAQTLGLMPPPNSYNPAGAFLGLKVAELAVTEFAVSFELPKIEKKENTEEFWLVAKDLKGKVVLEKEIPLINPLGDIAEEAVAEGSVGRFSRVGSRLAVKHATAIAASYATYKAVGGGTGGNMDFLAKNAAVVQYVAASKGIALSEMADTRYWSTLPNAIYAVDLALAPGDYYLLVEGYPVGKKEGTPVKTKSFGKITISKEKANYIQAFNVQ